ncbi:MAG: glycosyltransferase family 2 protein [Candidatus Gastranaerophilaceae bacterium]
MISIITASYNYSKYISETIKSVQTQTYSDWELIVVDDASTDNSVEIIRSFCDDKRIKLICHDKNKGLSKVIQTGLKYAKGEWIAFLESDDVWNKNALLERIQVIKNNPQVGIIFNDIEEFGDKNSVLAIKNNLENYRKKISNLSFPRNIFYDINVDNLLLTFSAVMIKQKFLENCPLNSPIDALLDWWIFIHVSFKNEAFYINKKLTKWRQHSDSYLYKKNNKTHRSVNIEAYIDVWKKEKLGIKFLPFILKTTILTAYKRGSKFYFIIIIRKIKKILGLKLKPSPLFGD